jgi:hypothetical protein
MNASILPWEAASKHSNGCMIWPPGKTSIRNRPPLISSTTFASRSAAPWSTSSAAVQVVDIRHLTFGCAMTFGASTTVAAPAEASIAPAFATNLRRSMGRTSKGPSGGRWSGDHPGSLSSQRTARPVRGQDLWLEFAQGTA